MLGHCLLEAAALRALSTEFKRAIVLTTDTSQTRLPVSDSSEGKHVVKQRQQEACVGAAGRATPVQLLVSQEKT